MPKRTKAPAAEPAKKAKPTAKSAAKADAKPATRTSLRRAAAAASASAPAAAAAAASASAPAAVAAAPSTRAKKVAVRKAPTPAASASRGSKKAAASASSPPAATPTPDPAPAPAPAPATEPAPAPAPTPAAAEPAAPVAVVSEKPASSSADLIQIALSFDTTGSMHPCIEVVKRSVSDTVHRLKAAIPNIEIAIIAHGDYQDAETTYDVTLLDFSTDEKLLCDFVKKVEHTCGFDSDECYEYALRKARTELSWKKNANKALVVIGDASPHPANCAANKYKIDWKDEARLLKDADVKVYAVRCLGWGSDAFYKDLARITNGFFLELHQLQAITNFMIAISLKEGANTENLVAYREEVRGKGLMTRNMKQLFTSLGAVAPGEKNDDEPDLDAVEPCRFQILDVTERVSIKDFVQKMGAIFKTGKGFYEYTKAEEVQDYKEIVLMKKSTGDMFTGNKARELAGIANHTKGKKATPPSSDKWTMFVQSTSYNRVLMPGTKFLYEAEEA